MRGNNVLGIILSNAHDEALKEITDLRTMGSVPFGSRYRLIDFPLSSMVNAGISKVGVITKSNYRSLMDHLGTGKPWDLSRKREGLFILPPFNRAGTGMYHDRVQALEGIGGFIKLSNEEYVAISDSNYACNLNFAELLQFHTQNGADITIAYKHGVIPKNISHTMAFSIAEGGQINDAVLNPKIDGEFNYSLNVYIMEKALLQRLVKDAISHNYESFEKDLIQRNTNRLKIFGYEVRSFCADIDSLVSYYNANMALLNPENRRDLFSPDRPIYTKVRDDMPARYGLGSNVKNSLVADGCLIEGEVENCVLFRGVQIGKGAKVRNSILMQSTYVSDNAHLDCVIADKSVIFKPDRSLQGAPSFPVYIGKGITV